MTLKEKCVYHYYSPSNNRTFKFLLYSIDTLSSKFVLNFVPLTDDLKEMSEYILDKQASKVEVNNLYSDDMPFDLSIIDTIKFEKLHASKQL